MLEETMGIKAIKSQAQKDRIKEYVIAYRAKQDELDTSDTMVYPIIPLSTAIKYNLIIPELLLHPTLMKSRKFFEDVYVITEKSDIVKKISRILEYELCCETTDVTLTDEAMKKIIKVHTRLTKTKKTQNESK